MNVHDRIDDLAALGVCGGLAPAEQSELDAHAAGCADCAARLREARDFHAWMSGAVRADAPPAGLEDRIVARLGAPKRFRGGRLIRWAAGLVAVAGLVFVGSRFAPAADGAPSTLYEVQDLMVRDGRAKEVAGLLESAKLQFWAEPKQQEFAEREVEKLKAVTERLGESDADGAGAKLGRLEDRAAESLSRGTVAFGMSPAESPAPEKPVPLPTQSDQKLVRNGRLSLEVVSYEETHGKLAAIVTEEKGYVADASSEKLQNGKTRATVVLRVPSERFDAVAAKLRALGTVLNQSVQVEDLTKAYADLEVRLKAKSAFLDRLRKLLEEGKGGVKELLEVEVQIGAAIAEIDQMKGEMRFYDNRISLSTITLELLEKDLGRPFEIVETLRASVALAAADVDAVHASAQKVFKDAGGRVADAAVSRGSDGVSRGTMKGWVAAAKYAEVREALRKLGHVTADTVDRRKTAQGGDPKADAPVRVEEALVDVTVSTPPEFVARKGSVTVEAADVEAAYAAARKAAESAGGRIGEGQLLRSPAGLRAVLRVKIDADRYDPTLEAFRALGKPKEQASAQSLPAAGSLVKEKGELELTLESPPALIGEEQGLGKVIRDTFKGSVAGVLWSLEKLFVGLSLAFPWALLGLAGWWLWRRRRKAKAA